MKNSSQFEGPDSGENGYEISKFKKFSAIRRGLGSFLRVEQPNYRKFLAELFGSYLFIIFIIGSVAQYVFSEKTSFISVNISVGIGLAITIIVVGKVSGGHVNPAVSLAFLLVGKMSLFDFMLYILAQFIGAFLAAVVVYLVYLNMLQNYPKGMNSIYTAGIFATYPADLNDSTNTFSLIMDQFFGTSILIVVVLSVTDKKNYPNIPHEVAAIIIGLSLVIIGTSLGLNSGYALNPARDVAPRIFTAMAGWGAQVFTAGNYFFWIPIVIPMFGSAFGALLYTLFISNNIPSTG